MHDSWTGNVILYRNFLGHIRHFNDVKFLSLSEKSTFKIIHLGGYVLIIDYRLVSNDDKKCDKNSKVNQLAVS